MAEKTPSSTFDDLVDVYDALINWPKRLAHESGFVKRLFTEANVKSVLDAACGTGHHAAMFHDWGLTVEGADLSPAMIARCRERFGEPERLSWVVRSFDDAASPRGRFDAVVCVGNSLALVPDLASVRRAVLVMIAALKPGGIGIFQVLNLWRVAEGPTQWQKCETRHDAAGQRVILKGMHRCGPRGFVDLVDLRMTPSGVVHRFDAPCFIGIEAEDLSDAVRSAGGKSLRLFGGYQSEPYERSESADLICVFDA